MTADTSPSHPPLRQQNGLVFSHMGFCVRDLPRMARFYKEVLGFTETDSGDLGAVKAFYGAAFGWTFTDYGPDYAGFDEDPLERHVALAAVAGCLADERGGVAVLNEHACTSLPSGIFSGEELGEESLDVLRSLPLTMLYCGFVKYEVEGVQGVWMRTYGAGRFGLPDFAVLAEGHHQGEQYSNMFNNIMAYLLDSGAELAAGHTMQIGEDRYMKLREPLEAEYFLHGPQAVLVTEIIDASQINKPADAQDD